jgi:hypothetical protein
MVAQIPRFAGKNRPATASAGNFSCCDNWLEATAQQPMLRAVASRGRWRPQAVSLPVALSAHALLLFADRQWPAIASREADQLRFPNVRHAVAVPRRQRRLITAFTDARHDPGPSRAASPLDPFAIDHVPHRLNDDVRQLVAPLALSDLVGCARRRVQRSLTNERRHALAEPGCAVGYLAALGLGETDGENVTHAYYTSVWRRSDAFIEKSSLP